MQVWKRLLVTGILLLFSGTVAAASAEASAPVAEVKPIQLYFGSQKVSPDIKAITVDGRPFVNLPFLNRILHIITAPNIESGDAFLQFGKLGIKLYRNNPVYYINGMSRSLPSAPFEKDGQFWVPMEVLLKLGLVIKAQDKQQINLDWAQNYLIEVGNVTYQNHPAFLLSAAQELQIKDYLLADPDRLVLELPGTSSHDALDTHFGQNSIVKQVHLEKGGPSAGNLLKLIFDLTKKVGYQIIQGPGQKNQAMIVFDSLPDNVKRGNQDLTGNIPRIQSINWLESNDVERLEISTPGEMNGSLSNENNPNQLIINFNQMQLEPNVQFPDIRSKFVRGIHLLTAKPSSVGIQIDLADKCGYTAEISPDRHRLSVIFKSLPLIGKTIFLDPGHGGEDDGASGRQGTREKDNNLEIAMHLKDLLEKAGAAVVLARTDDNFIGLYERASMANEVEANLFISIHTNFHPDFNIHGIGVYYYPGRAGADALGRFVLEQIMQSTGLASQGVIEEDFAVTRETQMPGILVETGFLSNMQEENIIKTPEFKSSAAMGIYQGILKYYAQSDKP